MKLMVDSVTDKVLGVAMVGPDSPEIMQVGVQYCEYMGHVNPIGCQFPYMEHVNPIGCQFPYTGYVNSVGCQFP